MGGMTSHFWCWDPHGALVEELDAFGPSEPELGEGLVLVGQRFSSKTCSASPFGRQDAGRQAPRRWRTLTLVVRRVLDARLKCVAAAATDRCGWMVCRDLANGIVVAHKASPEGGPDPASFWSNPRSTRVVRMTHDRRLSSCIARTNDAVERVLPVCVERSWQIRTTSNRQGWTRGSV